MTHANVFTSFSVSEALGAQSFHNEIGRRGFEAWRQHYGRDGYGFEAEGTLAVLAHEMNVKVVVGTIAMAMAQFIARASHPVVDDMH